MAEPEMAPAPVRDTATYFRAGRVVARTFSVWARTLPQLLLIAALVHLPVVACAWWLREMDEFSIERLILMRLLPVLEMPFFTRLVEGLAVLLVFQRLRGDQPRLVRSMFLGLRRFATIVLIAATVAAAILALPLAQLLGISANGAPGPVGGDLATIGSLAAFLVYALVFSVSIPAALVEGLGPFAAFDRSRRLTRGTRTSIFWVWVLFVLVHQVAIRTLGWWMAELHLGTSAIFVAAAADAFVASFGCVLPIVLYHELRETKEGIGIDELLKVFE